MSERSTHRGGTEVSRSEITRPQARPAELRHAPRVGKAWRERAQWVVRGGSAHCGDRSARGDDAVSQRHARAVIDLALRIGEAMLSTGSSTAEVVATVLRLIAAYQIRSSHVDITFTSITVSIHRGLHEDPMSVMRVVKVRSPDYTRLEEVQRSSTTSPRPASRTATPSTSTGPGTAGPDPVGAPSVPPVGGDGGGGPAGRIRRRTVRLGTRDVGGGCPLGRLRRPRAAGPVQGRDRSLLQPGGQCRHPHLGGGRVVLVGVPGRWVSPAWPGWSSSW